MNRVVLILVICLIFASACREEVTLSRDDRRAIDTLFRNQAQDMVHITDSICSIYRDSLYPVLLDSVLQQRRTEREKILKNRR